MRTNVVYNKSCVSMPEVDDNSVDCIMTSPPYWGLRDYGKGANQIWGGDNDCYHNWEIIDILRKATSGDLPSPKSIIAGKRTNAENRPGKPSEFCQFCHAWHGQLGLEPTLEMYLEHLLIITAECKRILKPTGVMYWNHGDSYHGGGRGRDKKYGKGRDYCPENFSKGNWYQPKCLLLQNFRLILGMISEQSWILRNVIQWNKPNAMPSSTNDRFTNKYEPVFMLVKNKKYWFDLDAIREEHQTPIHSPGRKKLNGSLKRSDPGHPSQKQDRKWGTSSGKNPGDVWTIPTQPYPEAHFATFPEKLLIKPILSSCPEGGIVLDPFAGSGTTLAMAHKYHRQYIGYELNQKYLKFIYKRVAKEDTLFNKDNK